MIPSASKSPKTRTRSPRSRARCDARQEDRRVGQEGRVVEARRRRRPRMPFQRGRRRRSRGGRGGPTTRGVRPSRAARFEKERVRRGGGREDPAGPRLEHPLRMPRAAAPALYRRVTRTRGARAAWRGQPALAPVLPLLPDDEERARVEDRRVGPRDDPDEEREDELLGRGAAEEEQRGQRQDDGEARRDRPAERLQERVVDDLGERLAGVAGAVLADPVEDDDRVVDAEADDREHRRHEQAVDLDVEERAQDGEEAEDDDDVVEEGDERGDAQLHVAEAEGDPAEDPEAPTRIRTIAWLMRSLLTTAPIELSEACSAIGPSAVWRPVAIRPISPSVGTWVLAPGIAVGAGEPLGPASRWPRASRSAPASRRAGLAVGAGAGPVGAGAAGGGGAAPSGRAGRGRRGGGRAGGRGRARRQRRHRRRGGLDAAEVELRQPDVEEAAAGPGDDGIRLAERRQLGADVLGGHGRDRRTGSTRSSRRCSRSRTSGRPRRP